MPQNYERLGKDMVKKVGTSESSCNEEDYSREEIRVHFDKLSVIRDELFEEDPFLDFEQRKRQETVLLLLDPKKGDRILDVGCGNGRDLMVYQMKGARCVGIDFSMGMAIEGKRKLDECGLMNGSILLADATELPFATGSFNKVVASEVLEHIPDYPKAIKEMVRVLKSHGKIVVTTPNRYGISLDSWVYHKIRGRECHPFDEWKTEHEITQEFTRNGVKIENTLGICYFPLRLMVLASPVRVKEAIVKIISMYENRIRSKLHSYGYMIGVLGRKE